MASPEEASQINTGIYENNQSQQIIMILRMGGIENVSPITADGLMRGTGIKPEHQLALMETLKAWSEATSEIGKRVLADRFASIVKQNQYLHLED